MKLAPYPSPEKVLQAGGELAARAGGEVRIFGSSVQGRPLHALRLPGDKPGLPRLLCTANIHGLEFIGTYVALQLADRFGRASGQWEALRRKAELWVIPQLNPDGYARCWEQEGRGKLAELRCNARGVDLNRNFPLPGGARPSGLPGTGSPKPGRPCYRGPAPLSEAESAALDSLLREVDFVASANLHAFMGTVIPARVKDRLSYRRYKDLARAFARAQVRVSYRRLANRLFDVFTGELEDHQHHVYGCWAVCIEHQSVWASFRQHLWAPRVFWRYNPRNPQAWADNDLPGLVAFFDLALRLPSPDLQS